MTPAQKAWETRRARAAETARRCAEAACPTAPAYPAEIRKTLSEMAAAFPAPSNERLAAAANSSGAFARLGGVTAGRPKRDPREHGKPNRGTCPEIGSPEHLRRQYPGV